MVVRLANHRREMKTHATELERSPRCSDTRHSPEAGICGRIGVRDSRTIRRPLGGVFAPSERQES